MICKTGFGILLLTLAAGGVLAQDADPPSRVARLNYLNGPVSFRPGSVEDWGAASLNYPLTTGDHLWADAGARVEMHIGSTAIRMDSQTALSILNLDDAVAQFSLTEGNMELRVRFMEPGDTYEVDTPNAAIVIRQPGEYRITARGDSDLTQVTVMAGDVDIEAGGGEYPLTTGQSVRLVGQDSVSQQMASMPMPDGFDDWCHMRDRREMGTVSSRYVPREMVGYEDLDEYGVWNENPQYGWVWTPRSVRAGWAPYHDGHWAWVEPWGWTWVDDAPWGFAPFHYGRWAYTGVDWVWVPGRMEMAVGMARVRPVYAPALVAFVGGGGVGMAAWFPLGPGEVYVPAYRVSPRYVESINIVHVRDVSVIRSYNVASVRYVNQSVRGAVVVVPHDAFAQSRHVSEVAVNVPHDQIVRARVVGYTAEVAPVRESVVTRSTVVVHAPPQRFVERQVVVQHVPPPPPVSFAAREQALRNNGGRPLDHSQMENFRRTAPAVNPAVRVTHGPSNGPAPRPANTGRPAENTNRQVENNRQNDNNIRPRPAERTEQPQVVHPNPPVNNPQGQGQTQNQVQEQHPRPERRPAEMHNEEQHRPAEQKSDSHPQPQQQEKKAPRKGDTRK